MPPQRVGPVRRLLPIAFVLVLAGALFLVARIPSASAAEREELASRFGFTELPIALPAGLPERTVRQVNPEYQEIRSWVSSVGAAVAVNDLQGTGVANDLCLVDTRSDSVVVTPVPGTGTRYAPFVLDPAPLPMGSTIAPMGCVPGDFNGDARMDILVYYWGRTPVVFLRLPVAGASTSAGAGLDRADYLAVELVPQQAAPDGTYHGPLWNTNAVAVADFDGDGHPDVGVFNYFPDSPVLDPNGAVNVRMNHSMSKAENAGGAHVLRWIGATGGDRPSISYQEQPGAVPPRQASGWTLGAASADIDGDLLPELYVANDFGNDHFFHNVSTPGHIRFRQAVGRRGAFTPKSMVLGHDSFKGMSIDFGDLAGTGRFDMFVSNITTEWGLEESNFVWLNNATDAADARTRLNRGTAPFDNKAASLNMAWTGWGWDAKMADFDNSGHLSVVQTDGFIKGKINRWPWLQELAASNDLLLENAQMWPKAGPGDDIAGSQTLAFWARQRDNRYVNIGADLGLDVPIPTRGVAVADADGNGSQDFAVARQWGPPAYYRNTRQGAGDFLGLRLYRPATDAPTGAATDSGTPGGAGTPPGAGAAPGSDTPTGAGSATGAGTPGGSGKQARPGTPAGAATGIPGSGGTGSGGTAGTTGGRAPGTPAYGAQVKITTADGRTSIAQLDGGGGHSGKRSFEVFFGLGAAAGRPVSAVLCWRDLDGTRHEQRLSLKPGWHDLMLTSQASEVPAR